MPGTLKISLDTTKYRKPTEAEIKQAKDYVLRMSEYSDLLGGKVMDVLHEAAERIVRICYKYNIRPKDFQFSANEQMRREVYQVMDEAEEEILAMMEEWATKCADNKADKKLLLAWILLLGRNGKGLVATLEDKMRQFLYDLEAQIAAQKMSGHDQAKAVQRVLATLTSVYAAPEMKKAFLRPLDAAAYYIRERGVHHGNFGQSSSGANNIVQMARTTLEMTWQKNLQMRFERQGAAGYLQLRGSSYICDICDAETGFHEGTEGIDEAPMVHPNCRCYRVPVYKKI